MFKELFRLDSVAMLSEAALLIFVLVFVVTAIWVFSRPKAQVTEWSQLPLEEPTDANRTELP